MPATPSKTPCPSCGEPLRKGARSGARNSPRANVAYAVAGVVGLGWIVAVALWSPVFLVPRGIGGIALCAIFYLGPGVGIATWASSIPRIQTTACSKCGWTETREIGGPPA